MKKGTSIKKFESLEYGKSTYENTTNDDKIKSINKTQKISDIPSIKRGKKIILYINNNHENKNTIVGCKGNKNFEKSKANKNFKIKKIISAQKISKTQKKIEDNINKINKTEIKKKIPEITISPSPIKNNLRQKKSILILSTSKIKHEKKNIKSQKSIPNSNYMKKKINYSKDEILTLQNTKKNQKIQKIKSIQNDALKNINKKKRKMSYDLSNRKISLPSKEIKISKKYSTPPIKHYIKRLNETRNNNLNKTFNQNITNKNKILNPVRNKTKDKSALLNKMKKNKFFFRTLVYRNKGESMRDKLISLSKNKNINSYTVPRNKKCNNINIKNKTMDEFKLKKYSIFQKNSIITKERISIDKIKPKKTYSIERKKKYLKNENNNNNLKNKLNWNLNYNKTYLNTENNIINKKFCDNINTHKSFHYLKLTICAQNKIVDNKKENNQNNNSPIPKRSKTIEKDIKSIKRKYKDKDKNKYYLIHRNTITRFKIKDKNNINNENKNLNNISNSNYSTLPNTSRIHKKIDEYEILKELGKGSYATVKLVIHKNNNNKYAMKIYSKKILLDPQKKNTVDNEIKILKQLDNSNIMKLYDVIDTPKYLYLIMEYIDGISLLDTIKKETNRHFEEQKAIKIFVQIIKANIYLQTKNICHRDLKLENVLILNNDIIKLIDFGFAIKTDRETYQTLFCGSPSYMAPEIVNKQKYIAQYSDIWSLGVLLYSMLYGRFPFKAKTQNELFQKINEAQVEFPNEIEINDKIKILLKKIFVIIPTQRPSLQEILNDILLLIN